MEVVPVDASEGISDDIKILANLLVKRNEDIYSHIPSGTQELYLNYLTSSPRPTHRTEYYLIRIDEDNIGYITLRYNLITDKHILGVDYYVLPVDQKSDVLARALEQVMMDLPEAITQVSFYWIRDEKDETEFKLLHFFNQIPDRLVYQERINVATFDQYDRTDVVAQADKLANDAVAKGYDFNFVENGKFEDTEDLDYGEFIRVVERIQNDMPKEDAEWEDEIVDKKTQNALYRNINELGGHHWSIVAVHSETGDIAGYTDIFFYAHRPGYIGQGDTGVVPEHRGNRLGKTLKYLMLQQILQELEEFEPTHWITGNANSNAHMLSINEEMGYKHLYTDLYYNLKLETFRYLLGI